MSKNPHKKLALFTAGLLFLSPSMYAQDCGEVSITNILTGPRHGAMMQVSPGCASWVCLDPDGEHMSQRESDRLFSFILAQEMANKKIVLSIKDGVYAAACNGPYPVVDDVRLK